MRKFLEDGACRTLTLLFRGRSGDVAGVDDTASCMCNPPFDKYDTLASGSLSVADWLPDPTPVGAALSQAARS